MGALPKELKGRAQARKEALEQFFALRALEAEDVSQDQPEQQKPQCRSCPQKWSVEWDFGQGGAVQGGEGC